MPDDRYFDSCMGPGGGCPGHLREPVPTDRALDIHRLTVQDGGDLRVRVGVVVCDRLIPRLDQVIGRLGLAPNSVHSLVIAYMGSTEWLPPPEGAVVITDDPGYYPAFASWPAEPEDCDECHGHPHAGHACGH